MALSGFDIADLRKFRPPRVLCVRCAAILTTSHVVEMWESPECPVCSVRYVETEDYGKAQYDDYLKAVGFSVEFNDALEQAKRLASIATIPSRYRPPFRKLIQSLNAAESFVHFMTFGISHQFIGMLKMVSLRRVAVRGIVAGVRDEEMRAELEDYEGESGRLTIKVYPDEPRSQPHQKLLVVDGLMAFKGSANLTLTGWRNAASGKENLEIATNVGEVMKLNNELFSPLWADLNDEVDVREDEQGSLLLPMFNPAPF